MPSSLKVLILGFLIVILGNVPLEAAEERFPLYYCEKAEIVIDGLNKDWPATFPAIIESDTQVKIGKLEAPTQFGGRIFVLGDLRYLYIWADISDDTPGLNAESGNNIYQGDCLEVYLGFHEKKRFSYGPADYQFGIALAPGTESWLWTKGKKLEGMEASFKKTEAGSCLEAKVPWSNFNRESLKDGEKIWLDFGIDNGKDGKERSCQLIWFGNEQGWQTPSVWKAAEFNKETNKMLLPSILTPPQFIIGKKQRIYFWNEGKPWQGEVEMGGEKFVTDNLGGVSYQPEQAGVLEIVMKVNDISILSKVEVIQEKKKSRITFPVNKIKVNQVGYNTREKKDFIVTDNEVSLETKEFKLVDPINDEVAYVGKLVGPKRDFSTNDLLYYGNFSGFKRPGRYKIVISGFAESYVFEIGDDVIADLFRQCMRSYYLQRCGMAVKDPESKVSYGACHLKDGYLITEPTKFLDVTGGWHDAGDYGKYIPTAGVTVAQLLLGYELMPEKNRHINLQIPESGQKLPDILAEVKYELNWMLKMQDDDGGVFHKVNSANFPGMISPDVDEAPRIIYEKGTAATAIFSGALALAARVYRQEDPTYADKLRRAALKGIQFLQVHQSEILWPTNGNTGAYRTSSVIDELYWAYAEMFRLTGEDIYLNLASEHEPNFSEIAPIGWENTFSLGIYALLKSPKLPLEQRSKLQKALIENADKLSERVLANGYHIALRSSEFNWGSNKNDLAQGVNLILAYQFQVKPEYRTAARYQLDYILGVNPLSKSFITEIGADCVRYSHHRLIIATKKAVPGLLVGGPNNQVEDGLCAKGLGARGYVDLSGAYSCNEYAIDYNAPLVFLAAYFSAE